MKVKVVDDANVPVTGARIDILTDRGGFLGTGSYSHRASGITDYNGEFSAILSAKDPEVTPGNATVTAIVHRFGDPDLVYMGQVSIVGPPAANGVTITGAPAFVTAGEPVTIGISVLDAAGQAVCDGTAVSLISTAGGTLSSPQVSTFGGQATAYLITSSQHIGIYTVIATVDTLRVPPISVQIRISATPRGPGSNWGGRPEQAFDTDVADSIARKQGLLAIVFTDIVDSTPLVRRLGDPAYLGVLEDHSRMVEGIAKRHGGSIANTTGDGFFLAFASAVEAADACFEIVESAHELDLRLRVGLHIGEPLPTGQANYIGVSANETARLMSKAEPDRIVISDATKRVLEGTPRFVYRSLGFLDLKGFDVQNEVFEIWRTTSP